MSDFSETTIFKIKGLRYFLVGYISLLLIWKIFLAMALVDITEIVPLSLQLAVIVLLNLESKYGKIFLQAWVVFFVLITQSIKIVAKLLASNSGEIGYITSATFAFNIFQFLMGWLMLYLARHFIRP